MTEMEEALLLVRSFYGLMKDSGFSYYSIETFFTDLVNDLLADFGDGVQFKKQHRDYEIPPSEANIFDGDQYVSEKPQEVQQQQKQQKGDKKNKGKKVVKKKFIATTKDLPVNNFKEFVADIKKVLPSKSSDYFFIKVCSIIKSNREESSLYARPWYPENEDSPPEGINFSAKIYEESYKFIVLTTDFKRGDFTISKIRYEGFDTKIMILKDMHHCEEFTYGKAKEGKNNEKEVDSGIPRNRRFQDFKYLISILGNVGYEYLEYLSLSESNSPERDKYARLVKEMETTFLHGKTVALRRKIREISNGSGKYLPIVAVIINTLHDIIKQEN